MQILEVPKMVIFGSPNSIVVRPKETIWKTVFDIVGENRSYATLRRGFKTGQLTPLQWAEASGNQLVNAGLTSAAYEKSVSAEKLLPGTQEFFGAMERGYIRIAIISGGFSDLCLRSGMLTVGAIDHIIAQATPVFDQQGKLINVALLNCDYQGKVHYAGALANSLGFSLEECVFIVEGEGDIPLSQAMPSVAFNATRVVERACNVSVKSGSLAELLNLFAVKEKEVVAEAERRVPHTVLLGNQKSDAVLVDFDGKPSSYGHLLHRFAAVGPLMTNVPGVSELIRNIEGTGIRLIYVTGKPSVFKPDVELRDAVGNRPHLRIRSLEDEVGVGERESDVRFVHRAPEAREVFQSPFVPDTFSFVVYEFSDRALADVYRDRVKIESVIGSSRAVLENIVARYGSRVSASNTSWLAEQLLGSKSAEQGEVLEFDNLQEAYVPLIMKTWLEGRKYVDERGEEATELNPLIIRIRNVEESTLPKSEALDETQTQRYVRQFLGEESAEQFDYDVWGRIKEQIDDVVRMLKQHPETRRAHLLVAREDDVRKALQGVEQPCHFALDFVVKEGKLDVYAYARSSGDVVRALPADAFAAMQLQLRIAKELSLEAGTYTHITTRAQIYSRDYGLVERLRER